MRKKIITMFGEIESKDVLNEIYPDTKLKQPKWQTSHMEKCYDHFDGDFVQYKLIKK